MRRVGRKLFDRRGRRDTFCTRGRGTRLPPALWQVPLLLYRTLPCRALAVQSGPIFHPLPLPPKMRPSRAPVTYPYSVSLFAGRLLRLTRIIQVAFTGRPYGLDIGRRSTRRSTKRWTRITTSFRCRRVSLTLVLSSLARLSRSGTQRQVLLRWLVSLRPFPHW